jgi:hypothetical protein
MKKLNQLKNPLSGNYLEVREGRGSYQGYKKLLIYKDARADMNILDDVVGASNWQRKHYEVKGNLFCSVGIYDQEKSIWVWKDDAGAPSTFEKEKGESSDSFKRACTNWGIGRELYSDAYKNISVKVQDKESLFGWRVLNKVEKIKEIYTVTAVGIIDTNGNTRFKKIMDSKSGQWVKAKTQS